MKLYEFNQANYGRLPTFTEEDFEVANKTLMEYVKEFSGKYYMLLNHELHYFTMFHQESLQFRHHTVENILAILKELGEVKSIEKTNDQMGIECWVTFDGDPEDTHMFLLFNYDRGVVESK